MNSPSVSFAVACNDDAVLSSSLLASPDIAIFNCEVSVMRGATSAAKAYNAALDGSVTDIAIFVHQDVYLPPGWLVRFQAMLEQLAQTDPNWGVLGLYGVTMDRTPLGWVYSTGLNRVLGSAFAVPQAVRTLDEVLLVVRKSSGLRFDEALPGFHMYGTDICLESERRGMQNFVVPCFAIHNSNGIKQLPWAFWRACVSVRRKWSDYLPIHAPCASLTPFLVPLMRHFVSRAIRFSLQRASVGKRVSDPSRLYSQIAHLL